MAIRGKAITVNLYAFNNATNLPASGLTDISGYIIKDGATPVFLTSGVIEPSAFNTPGIYQVYLTASEMDANSVTVGGKSFLNPTGIIVYPWMATTENNYLGNISGYTDSLELGQATLSSQNTSIAGSGLGWVTATTVTTTGINPTALSDIVSSGDAAGWGAVNTLTAEQIAGEVTLSGNTANWSGVADVSNVGVGTISASALSSIVASGNADGWAADTGLIVSGIFDEIVNGTKTYRVAFEEIWAYTVGEILASGTNPFFQTYLDMAGANMFTLNVSGTGRSKS